MNKIEKGLIIVSLIVMTVFTGTIIVPTLATCYVLRRN